jgi:plasmid stability protein
VAVKLKAAAKHRPFKTVINEVLRAGLSAMEKRAPVRKPHRTRGFDLGPSLVGSLDNVEEVLSRVEGEDHG